MRKFQTMVLRILHTDKLHRGLWLLKARADQQALIDGGLSDKISALTKSGSSIEYMTELTAMSAALEKLSTCYVEIFCGLTTCVMFCGVILWLGG